MIETATEPDTATAVLVAARSSRQVADAAEVELLQHAVAWAAMHSVDSIEDSATLDDGCGGDTGVPVAAIAAIGATLSKSSPCPA